MRRYCQSFDRQRYQTIYAKTLGSVAAPTASLHFTKNILKAFKEKGVNIATVPLHVGWETFRSIIFTELKNP